MDYLPLAFDLRQRLVLLVGGGPVALRKLRLLLRAGARVHLVAPELVEGIQELLGPQVCWRSGVFEESDLESVCLVIAATDDRAVNAEVSATATRRGLWVNAVDQPECSTFIMPALVDRSPLLVAISSGGASPVLARLVRTRIEAMLPGSFGRLAALSGALRHKVKKALPELQQRRRFWEEMLQGRFAELALQGQTEAATAFLETSSQGAATSSSVGEVFLVGAGPGDPDLLTFKAMRLMQQADVVLYDRLVSPEILERCRRDAEFVYVGKARADHAVPQPQINELLVAYARKGLRVCRLKGGDPFIFGRGGEEIEHLAAEGIAFQVVPGISAANGCAAYAGIPLTHRDYAQSVRFLAGHVKDGVMDIPWNELMHSGQTLVFYMALVSLPLICQTLMQHGRHPDTPVAVIARGTLPDQKVICGTLTDIAELVAQGGLRAPTLTIIGDVVRLRARLAWGEPV